MFKDTDGLEIAVFNSCYIIGVNTLINWGVQRYPNDYDSQITKISRPTLIAGSSFIGSGPTSKVSLMKKWSMNFFSQDGSLGYFRSTID